MVGCKNFSAFLHVVDVVDAAEEGLTYVFWPVVVPACWRDVADDDDSVPEGVLVDVAAVEAAAVYVQVSVHFLYVPLVWVVLVEDDCFLVVVLSPRVSSWFDEEGVRVAVQDLPCLADSWRSPQDACFHRTT